MMASSKNFKPSKILVPTDFSPSSDVALRTASDLAQHYGAKLYLLHVLPMFQVFTGLEDPTRSYPGQQVMEEAQRAAEASLLASVTALTTLGLHVRSFVDVGDDVVGKILGAVEQEQADLLVISTHGFSGWRPMIFGSTAEKVVKLVECPILLLRSVKPDSAKK
jgi:nucleotide-binding universal stress UspA family protein